MGGCFTPNRSRTRASYEADLLHGTPASYDADLVHGTRASYKADLSHGTCVSYEANLLRGISTAVLISASSVVAVDESSTSSTADPGDGARRAKSRLLLPIVSVEHTLIAALGLSDMHVIISLT